MANIVDSVAEDATREWIEIETNRDVDNSDTGEKGLNISRILLNEMEEFDLRGKIEEHIRNSRMDHGGSILFWGIKSDIPQTDFVLSQPLPETIRNLVLSTSSMPAGFLSDENPVIRFPDTTISQSFLSGVLLWIRPRSLAGQ
ncbi:DUF1073 domain-containing protein [Leptospira noguchii]|nr:anti-CBASS Acb1 family protein [Leptospira noguchii]MCH1917211.1 DUF1073 domain-containing protein [Leptospira noguchii]